MDIEAFGRRLIDLLPQLIRGFARREHNALSRGAITLPQLWALEYLARQGSGTPMNELARWMGVTRPAATGLIDRLIAQGLAQRRGDSQDRRVVRVAITGKGRRILLTIWEQKRRMIVEVFGRIAATDRVQYLTTLERVVSMLSEPSHKK